MFVLPTFGLGVIASPTFTSIFDSSLTFATIQVFDKQSEFIYQTDAPNYTIIHAKDTDKLYVWETDRWYVYNNDSTV